MRLLSPFYFTALLLVTPCLPACVGPDVVSCADGTLNCINHANGTTPVADRGTTTGGSFNGTLPGGTGAVAGATSSGTTTGGVFAGTATGVAAGGATAGSTTTGGTTTGGTTTGGTTAGGNGFNFLVVEDFSDTATFNNHLNALNHLQSDNGTMTIYADPNGSMELDCATTGCFWYSLLAAQGTCLDISSYTYLTVDVQGGPGADATLQLQNNSADCASTTFTGSANVDLASYGTIGAESNSVTVPLSAFTGVDLVHSRAIALLNLNPNVPIYVSSVSLWSL